MCWSGRRASTPLSTPVRLTPRVVMTKQRSGTSTVGERGGREGLPDERGADGEPVEQGDVRCRE